MATTHSRTLGTASRYVRLDAAAAMPALWLFVRLLLGVEWLRGAEEKLGVTGWTADPAGTAVTAFMKGALAKATGAHPEVQGWFTSFANQVVLPHSALFAYLVTFGELLVGIALIIGLCTRFAALGGAFLNFMFLSAGTTSSNPQMLLLELTLVFLGSTAGAYGLDRWVLPRLARIIGERRSGIVPTTVTLLPALLAVGALGYICTDQITWLTASAVAVIAAAALVPRRSTSAE